MPEASGLDAAAPLPDEEDGEPEDEVSFPNLGNDLCADFAPMVCQPCEPAPAVAPPPLAQDFSEEAPDEVHMDLPPANAKDPVIVTKILGERVHLERKRGLRIYCSIKGHEGCNKYRALSMGREVLGRSCARDFLHMWVSRGPFMTANEHSRFTPSLQEVQEHIRAFGGSVAADCS